MIPQPHLKVLHDRLQRLHEAADQQPLLRPWIEAADEWLHQVAVDRRPATLRYHLANLYSYLRWMAAEAPVALPDFTRKHLRLYLAAHPHWSENTRSHYQKSLKSLLAFCVAEGRLPTNPLADLKIAQPAATPIYCPTAEDLRRLLAAIQAHWRKPRGFGHTLMSAKEKRFYCTHNLALIYLLIDTGCRIHEALSLHVSDLHLDGRDPYAIFPTRKGGRTDTLPLSRFCREALLAYLALRPKGTPQNPVSPDLFLTQFGTPYTYDQIQRRLIQYRKEAGLTARCTLHSLRHYAITEMAEQNLFAAQQMAGHGDGRVTERYKHARGAHLRQSHTEANQLGKILGDDALLPKPLGRKKKV